MNDSKKIKVIYAYCIGYILGYIVSIWEHKVPDPIYYVPIRGYSIGFSIFIGEMYRLIKVNKDKNAFRVSLIITIKVMTATIVYGSILLVLRNNGVNTLPLLK